MDAEEIEILAIYFGGGIYASPIYLRFRVDQMVDHLREIKAYRAYLTSGDQNYNLIVSVT